MTFSERLQEIRTGFERPFWVANITELFERLSYYAAFASLARYLHETLNFPVEQASSLTGLFGGLVWFLAAFRWDAGRPPRFPPRTLAGLPDSQWLLLPDRLDRRSVAGSGAQARCRWWLWSTVLLMLPALGVALVKPCVVGTTARASKENVRSIGYSIYYTLVNIGGAAGSVRRVLGASAHERRERLSRRRPQRVCHVLRRAVCFSRSRGASGRSRPSASAQVRQQLWDRARATRGSCCFLLIFSGYWIVFWQQFIILPIYIHDYINPKTDTELILVTGPVDRDLPAVVVSLISQKIPAFRPSPSAP